MLRICGKLVSILRRQHRKTHGQLSTDRQNPQGQLLRNANKPLSSTVLPSSFHVSRPQYFSVSYLWVNTIFTQFPQHLLLPLLKENKRKAVI